MCSVVLYLRITKSDSDVKGKIILAVDWLTEQLCLLPGNISFPATQSSREFEDLGTTQN